MLEGEGLTPIYFKSEVLDKYRSRPSTFHMGAEYVGGKTWNLGFWKAEGGLLGAYLKDVCSKLPQLEQQHWKLYNIPHNGSLPVHVFSRDFQNKPLGPVHADDKLRSLLASIRYGWPLKHEISLYSELHPNDEYLENQLQIPDNPEQAHLDTLAGSMYKLLIEYINVSQLKRHLRRGEETLPNDPVEVLKLYLVSFQPLTPEESEKLSAIRLIKDFRDASSGHRKSSEYNRILKKMGPEQSAQAIAERMVMIGVDFLEVLARRL